MVNINLLILPVKDFYNAAYSFYKIHKLQYRWKAVFRNAYKIAKEIIPYSITKKEALQKIIDYYEKGVE